MLFELPPWYTGGAFGIVFVLEGFTGLSVLMRAFLLRVSKTLSADWFALDRVLLLVVSAQDPSIELISNDGITNSGSGDLFSPLVDLRGVVTLRTGGLYSSSCGEYSGLSSSPSTTQESPRWSFCLPGGMVNTVCCC